MFSWLTFEAVCLALVSSWVSGDQLVFVNNSKEVANNIYAHVVLFDTETKDIQVIANGDSRLLNSGYEFLSGACICGDMYYAVWVDVPIEMGLIAVDLKDEKIYVSSTGYQYHTLSCLPSGSDGGNNSFLAVATQSTTEVTLNMISFDSSDSNKPFSEKVLTTFDLTKDYAWG